MLDVIVEAIREALEARKKAEKWQVSFSPMVQSISYGRPLVISHRLQARQACFTGRSI